MPTEYPRYRVAVKIGDIEFKTLLDTGAARSAMSRAGFKKLSKLGLSLQVSDVSYARMANGALERIAGELTTLVEVEQVCKQLSILVVENLPTDLLLGLDFVRKFGMNILGTRDAFTLADRGDQTEFAFDLWAVGMTNETIDVASVGLAHLTELEQTELKELIDEMLPVPKIHSKILAKTHLMEHEILLNPGTQPVKQKYFPVSEAMEKNMHAELEKLIEQGVVEESASEWNNPTVMAKKHNGDYRLCIDFRVVNSMSKKDSYPTPHMDTILNELKRAKYISLVLKLLYFYILI